MTAKSISDIYFYYDLAGVLGFEPRNAEIKTRCLTAWLHPNFFLTLRSAYFADEQVECQLI